MRRLPASTLLVVAASAAVAETVLPSDDRQLTKDEIVAAIPPADADHGRETVRWCSPYPDTQGSAESFFLVIHGEDEDGRFPMSTRFTLYARVGDRYARRVGIDLGRSDAGWFDPPVWFHHRVVDSSATPRFVAVTRWYDGTGRFHTPRIWSLDAHGGLQPVDFVPAPKTYAPRLAAGEEVAKGESDRFADDELSYAFDIWNHGDANCCPTAGRVTGTYRVLAFAQPPVAFGEPEPPPRYRIEMATSERGPLPPRR
jgi:hypothetical protein